MSSFQDFHPKQHHPRSSTSIIFFEGEANPAKAWLRNILDPGTLGYTSMKPTAYPSPKKESHLQKNCCIFQGYILLLSLSEGRLNTKLLDLRTLGARKKTFETKTTGGANETNSPRRTSRVALQQKKSNNLRVGNNTTPNLEHTPWKPQFTNKAIWWGFRKFFCWRTGDCRTGLVVRYQGVTTVGGSQLQIGQWFSHQFEKICACQIGSCPRVGVSCHQHGEKNNLLETA